jgi:hypothetical protein
MRHTYIRHLVSTVAAVLLLAAVPCLQAHSQESWRFTEAPRVVAFGDVHGAYPALVELLQTAGLVDSELHWTGGRTHAVSLGDLLDRGPDVRQVLDLVMRLQGEARAAGGDVHVVLGNHEAMNLIGDWRYVSAADYASFAADETPDERAAAYAAFAAGKTDADDAEARAEFDRRYPPGYFARHRAFAADGPYGAWLLTLPAIVVVNDTAYVHGGLSPLLAKAGLDINEQIATTLRRHLALRRQLVAAGVLSALDWQNSEDDARRARDAADKQTAEAIDEFIATADAAELSSNGPLWYRGDEYCKPLLETDIVTATLERLEAERAVVGHTPTGDHRVHSGYDGRVVMLDTGMLAAYFGGRASALVSEGARTYVQYTMPAEQAPIEAGGSPQAYGLTDAALRNALATAKVATVDRAGNETAWRVTLAAGAKTIDAVFYPRSNGGNLELAAAAVDGLLGSGLMTATVEREIEGQPGALQLRSPDALTEAQRRERRLGAGAWCPLDPQLAMMRAFDALIGNRGRNATNVVWRLDLSDLTLTDHRLAFDPAFVLPASFDPRTLDMPAPFVAALKQLDKSAVRDTLAPWLNQRQIAALLVRRDQLVRR